MNITFIYTNDYEAIYFDGKKHLDNTSVNFKKVMEDLVGHTIESFEELYIDSEYMKELGWSFPDELSELSLEKCTNFQ